MELFRWPDSLPEEVYLCSLASCSRKPEEKQAPMWEEWEVRSNRKSFHAATLTLWVIPLKLHHDAICRWQENMLSAEETHAMQRQRPGSQLLNYESTVSRNMAVLNQSSSAIPKALRGYYRSPYIAFHTRTMSKPNDDCQHRHTLSNDLTLYISKMHFGFMLRAKKMH